MRSTMVVRCCALAAALVTGMLLVPSAVAAGAGSNASTRTIAFGADTKHSGGVSQQASVTNLESEIGQKLAFTRDFLRWDDPFPTSYENWLGARGTEPMISVKSRLANGTAVTWASVANAQPGSSLYNQIVSWADRVRDFGYPVYFTYNHEPEAAGNLDLGTATDYIAAWRHVYDIFHAEGATNARFMWIMTDYSFRLGTSDRRHAAYWYPGDAYVDGIAADAYNWSTCRYANGAWETLATDISGFMKFGAQHQSIPMWLTEFASTEGNDSGQAKAQWIQQAESLLQQPEYSQIVGVAYFNQMSSGFPNCKWPVESSTAATSALRTLAQDPFFQGSIPTDTPPPPPPPGGLTFEAADSTTANAPTETVNVPDTVTAGDGLVLIATSSATTLPTAPPGWTLVSSTKSAAMASAVWQRVAGSGDADSSVPIGFGGTVKGSVELLAYSGTNTDGPVAAASAATVGTNTATLRTPSVAAITSGQELLSYWAARSSVDTTITPPTAVTERSTETMSGGGRITSASGDSATGSGGLVATVSPSVGHGLAWSVVLDPAA